MYGLTVEHHKSRHGIIISPPRHSLCLASTKLPVHFSWTTKLLGYIFHPCATRFVWLVPNFRYIFLDEAPRVHFLPLRHSLCLASIKLPVHFLGRDQFPRGYIFCWATKHHLVDVVSLGEKKSRRHLCIERSATPFSIKKPTFVQTPWLGRSFYRQIYWRVL